MTDREPRGESAGAPAQPGYERSDLSTRVVVMFAAVLVAAGLIIHLLVWLLYAYFGHAAGVTYSRQYPLASVGPAPLPAAPMLQVKPREELKQLRADEEAVLTGYAWVDPNTRIVRIPIDRAMQLVVERGLPTRSGAGETPPLTGSSQGSSGGPGTLAVPEHAAGQTSRVPLGGQVVKQGAASGPRRK